MIRRWLKRGLLGLLLVFALLLGGFYFLAGNESGTQWLYARAQPYLPEPLELKNLRGTLLSDLMIEQLRWRDTGIDVVVDDIALSMRIGPLLRRHVAINTLDAKRVLIVSTPDPAAAPSEDELSIELPVRISVDAVRILDINLQTPEQLTHLDRLELSGEARGSIIDLESLLIESDWLHLDGELRTRLSPPYDSDGEFEWSVNNVGATELAGSLRIKGDVDGYRVDHSLTLPLAMETEGSVRLKDNTPYVELDNSWDALEWTLSDEQVLRSSGGRLNISGGVDSYAIVANASLQLDDWPEAMFAANGEGSLGEFNLAMLRADSELAKVSASGNVNWQDEPRWSLAFDVAELAVDQLSSELKGSINATGTTTGHLVADEELAMEFIVERLSGNLNDHPIDGAMTVSAQDGHIDIANSSISVSQNQINAQGRVVPGIDLQLNWDTPTISELLPDAAGQSKGQAHVQQVDAGWSVSGNATAQEVSWSNSSIGSLAFDGKLSTFDRSDASIQTSELIINDQKLDTANGRITGTPASHRIEFDAALGERTALVRANGGYQESHWTGNLETIRVTDGERSEWLNESAAVLKLANYGISLEAICLTETVSKSRLCANADSLEDGTLQASATLDKVPLAQLPFALLLDEVDVDGFVAAEIDVEWKDSLLNGSASIRLDEAQFTSQYEGETLSTSLERAVASATVVNNAAAANAELTLSSGGSATARFDISDVTDSQAQVQGDGVLELTDLSFIPLFLPSISDTKGAIEGSLSVGGHLDAATLGGDLRLVGGAFRANTVGVMVTDIGLQLRQDVNGQLSLTGNAQSGGGHLTVNGDSRIDAQRGLVTTVSVSGENFEFIRLPEWQAAASPEIQLTMDKDTALVRGNLNVPSASIVLKSLPETAESVSQDAVVHGRDTEEDSATRRFDIDVQASLGDDVKFSGFGLDTELAGALRLRGNSEEPFIGTGRIELREGEYKAYGQTLEIESGALLFSGPLTSPTLDVRATRRVGNVVAGLNLTGTPTALRSTVYSEPALSDAEALSYLITGRALATADEQESNRVGQAAFALGLTGADKVFAQLQSKWGLDSLTLDNSGDVGRIVAGRRIGGRLMVEYGYGLVDRLGTLLLRYQLNDRIVVESTTGTASTLDIVYSVKKH